MDNITVHVFFTKKLSYTCISVSTEEDTDNSDDLRVDVSVSAGRRSIEFRQVQQLDVVEGVLADTGVFQRVATTNTLAEANTNTIRNL